MSIASSMSRIVYRLQPTIFRHLSSTTMTMTTTTTISNTSPASSSPPPTLDVTGIDTQAGGSPPSAPASHFNTDREKRFVRIAGPSSHASKEDITYFLNQHGVEIKGIEGEQNIVQGQSDIFQNHSVWILETESQRQAFDIASKISGRVLGLKLIRAAAVDQKLYNGLVAPIEANNTNNTSRNFSLRKRMAIIAPTKEERGRCLLAKNLAPNVYSRSLWSFFSAYDVIDVRHLRRSGVACIIFDSEEEASRALRERKNVPIQRQYPLSLKMHE